MKILIVDDDLGTLNALKANLTSAGYEVTTAAEGNQALKLIQGSAGLQEPYHLLITDLKMPGLNGLELIRKAKGSAPLLACILMTAFGSERSRHSLNLMRNCIYLEKPFALDSLIDLIRTSQQNQKLC